MQNANEPGSKNTQRNKLLIPAGDVGIEPTLAVLETAVLPLN